MTDTARIWRAAALLAVAALLCGVLLVGLSAWFLASVALAGLTTAALTFNFHVPGALVRLFAIGRTAAKYGERLVGHKAALIDQIARRTALFRAMAAAPATLRAGWQLGKSDRLADYLEDVDDVDFARLRVDLPGAALAAASILTLAATAYVAPPALPPVLVAALFLALLGRRRTASARNELGAARAGQRRGSARLGAALAAVTPLKAHRAFGAELSTAADELAAADRALATLRRHDAALEAVAGLFGPLAGLCVIAAAFGSDARGEALTPALFVGFAWLALGDSVLALPRMLTARVRRILAEADLARWTAGAFPAAAKASAQITRLDCKDWPRIGPDGRTIGAPVSLTLAAGRPTFLVGPSGVGKTSLLKQLAGWIGDDIAQGDGGALDAAARRAASLICLHDAALLSDTVRANLFANHAGDEELWAAIDAVEMRPRVELAGGLDGWIDQGALSLGEAQRLNLARALLSDKPVVLLDEPTEHLDEEQGRRLLQRALAWLAGRIVVISTHRRDGVDAGNRVELP